MPQEREGAECAGLQPPAVLVGARQTQRTHPGAFFTIKKKNLQKLKIRSEPGSGNLLLYSAELHIIKLSFVLLFIAKFLMPLLETFQTIFDVRLRASLTLN